MKQELSRIASHIIWHVGAIKISDAKPFRLTSGNMSPVYVDCRALIAYPAARDLLTSSAHWLYENEGLQADYIAGGETAGIPYAAWLAERLNQPFIYVRKEPKGHGRASQIEGDLKPGSLVLLYEDLITDGGSKLRFIEGIARAGGTVKNCLVVLDRQQGGAAELRAHGVALHSLTDLSRCLQVGLEAGRISENDAQSVQDYLQDTRAWHAARGLEFRG